MNDDDFLEWWDGCAWWKTDAELNTWPREKLAEIQATRDAMSALIYTAERTLEMIVSVSDRYDLEMSMESAKAFLAGRAAGDGGVDENASPKEATDNVKLCDPAP